MYQSKSVSGEYRRDCKLPGRNGKRKAQQRRQPWYAMDKARLRSEYGKMPVAELAARMGRTKSSVKRMAGHLGLAGENHRPWKWTEARRKRFVEAYRESPAMAADRFGLSLNSAWTYSKLLRIHLRKPWTAEHDELLKSMYSCRRDDEFCELTGRTRTAMRLRANKLGLKRVPKKNDWTSWRFSEARPSKEART